MRVIFDGLDAVSTEFVSSTTLIATTPAHAPGDRLGRGIRRAAGLPERLDRRRVPLHRYDAAAAVVRLQRRPERGRLVQSRRDAVLGLDGQRQSGDLHVRVRHGGHRCRYARHDLHVHRDERRRHVVALGDGEARRDGRRRRRSPARSSRSTTSARSSSRRSPAPTRSPASPRARPARTASRSTRRRLAITRSACRSPIARATRATSRSITPSDPASARIRCPTWSRGGGWKGTPRTRGPA